MPRTLVEKILLAHTEADDVSPGEIVMMNDLSGQVALHNSDARSCSFRHYRYGEHSP